MKDNTLLILGVLGVIILLVVLNNFGVFLQTGMIISVGTSYEYDINLNKISFIIPGEATYSAGSRCDFATFYKPATINYWGVILPISREKCDEIGGLYEDSVFYQTGGWVGCHIYELLNQQLDNIVITSSSPCTPKKFVENGIELSGQLYEDSNIYLAFEMPIYDEEPEPEENITEPDENITIICPTGFDYNEVTEKCEKHPGVSTICTAGTYNSATGLCEVYPDIKEFDLKDILEQYKIAIIIIGIILFLLIIGGRRR